MDSFELDGTCGEIAAVDDVLLICGKDEEPAPDARAGVDFGRDCDLGEVNTDKEGEPWRRAGCCSHGGRTPVDRTKSGKAMSQFGRVGTPKVAGIARIGAGTPGGRPNSSAVRRVVV